MRRRADRNTGAPPRPLTSSRILSAPSAPLPTRALCAQTKRTLATRTPATRTLTHPTHPTPFLAQDTFIVARLLGKNAFGYEPSELEGKSILSILHPADHRPFVQTARALLAMAAGTPGVVTPPQSVRALHRVFFRRLGQTSEVMVDSIITAKRPDRRALPPSPPSVQPIPGNSPSYGYGSPNSPFLS